MGQAGQCQNEVHEGGVGWRSAEDVQAPAYLGVLQLAEVAVDFEHELVEVLTVPLRAGRAVPPVETEVAMNLGVHEELPDLAAHCRKF